MFSRVITPFEYCMSVRCLGTWDLINCSSSRIKKEILCKCVVILDYLERKIPL